MTDGAEQNGHGGRVTYRDEAPGSIPAEWVEPMLRRLYSHHRVTFGQVLAYVATGEYLTQPRNRPERDRT